MQPSPLFDELIDWLDQGAPHVIFSMGYTNRPVHTLVPETFIWEDVQDQIKAKPECGSVCCIAGYLLQLAGEPVDQNDEWDEVQERALELLGLPPIDTFWDANMLPVFSPNLAPHDCTPQQAAAGLRQWRDDGFSYKGSYDPWLT